MVIVSFALMIILLAMATLHVVLGFIFARRLNQLSSQQFAEHLPKAAVVMALRGSDPFLRDTLRQLGEQDYPDFQIVIVVDHESDPAWAVCKEAQAELGESRLRLAALREPREECSLKCSCLIQAVESLSEETEVVAFADADVVPHRTWLRELVGPLVDETIGATTGNQWFLPRTGNLGSTVRSVWNAGAIVPTTLLGHPWAGSCAMRRSQMIESGLLDSWKNSIVDDGPVAAAMAKLDLKVHFVPSIFMLNQESCRLSFCWSYIKRMLTWSRLFESTYFLTVCHAVFLQACVLLAIAFTLVNLGNANWFQATALFVSLLIFWIGNVIGYQLIANSVRKHSHDERADWSAVPIGHRLFLMPAVPLTHLIYLVSAIRACFVRKIEWRKVTYQIEANGKVKLVEYRPFSSNDSGEANLSL